VFLNSLVVLWALSSVLTLSGIAGAAPMTYDALGIDFAIPDFRQPIVG
jgi:hypothetical protein